MPTKLFPWAVLAWTAVCAPRPEAATSIGRMSPVLGSPGTEVSITGNDLAGAIRVTFGGVLADFTLGNPSGISAIVPRGALSGVIRVETAKGEAISAEPFQVSPRIESTRPTRAAPGTSVLLEGANFVGVTNVFLGSQRLDFRITSESQISATLPTNALSSRFVVVSAAGFGLSSENFPVTSPAPILDTFEPAVGAPGSQVRLFGANFSCLTQVLIGGSSALFATNAFDQLDVVVPAAAATGPIVVRGARGSVTSSLPFTVTRAPVVQSFDPVVGSAGSQVRIEGINFNEITGVSFNGRSVPGIGSGAPGQLLVAVPAGATTGSIRVTNRFGTGVSATPFTITSGPLITTFDPPYGPAGSTVRIEGYNFSGLNGAAAVRFGKLPATTYTVTADTQLQVTVPPGFSEGNIVLSNRFGASTSAVPFLVTGQAPFVTSVEPLGGPRGTQVLITGVNLGDAKSVRFNGQPTPAFEITAPTQIFATAPPGVTTGLLVVSNAMGISSNAWFYYAPPRITSISPAASRAGEMVTVKGTNFFGTTSLALGLLPLPFESVATNEIRFVMPDQAVRGKLTLETPGGVVTSFQDAAILPGITAFSPAFGPPGTVVGVTGYGLAVVSEVRLGEIKAEFVALSPNRLEFRVPAGATNGLVSIRTPDGSVQGGAQFIVTGAAELRASVEVQPEFVKPGENFTWIITVTNAGPFAASRVGVTNSFPSAVKIGTVAIPYGSFVTNLNRIDVQLGLVTNAQAVQLRFEGKAAVSGYYTNVTRVFGGEIDPLLENNIALGWARVIGDADRSLSLQGPAPERRAVVSWPVSGAPLDLETTADLVPPILWLPLRSGIVVSDGRRYYTNTTAGRERYFRLVAP